MKVVARAVDTVCPPRLGGGFRWLLSSSWATNIGDGLALAAGPLLVASQTDDPLLVALAGFLEYLPWVLFGLPAGVIADRFDRRTIIIFVNLARVAVIAVLATAIFTGVVNVAIVLIVSFLLGTAEAIVDITSETILPMLVDHEHLGVANARLSVGHVTFDHLVGPPVGAFLFAAGMAVPFVTQAVLVALGALLISRISLPPITAGTRSRPMRGDIAQGVRWLWRHPAIRALTLTILSFNITFGATLAILVLYADQRLGLDAVGFGLLTTASAIGGVVGNVVYGPLERRLGMAWLMRIGLVIEIVTHLTLALTTTAAVAMSILLLFGVHESVWGVTETTIRQRAVPTELQGRVGSVYLLALMGGLAVGAAIGGILARIWGITAPFWFAFAGSVVILALIWRRLADIAVADSSSTVPAGAYSVPHPRT
jgi:MFS family permease